MATETVVQDGKSDTFIVKDVKIIKHEHTLASVDAEIAALQARKTACLAAKSEATADKSIASDLKTRMISAGIV